MEIKRSSFPLAPGVYLMKDRAGKILYIGKARSLRHRVRSYFQPAAEHPPRVAAFIRQTEAVETIVTDSEHEALVLESNLIKKHKPPYNVLLRDDKHYPYLKLTINEPYPRLIVVRRIEKDGAQYFGPFSGGTVRQMIELIHRVFPLRSCPDLTSRKHVCLEYHIKRCLGPCVYPISPETYQQMVKEVALVLQGRYDFLARRLETEMQVAARELAFEKAAVLRNRLRAVQAMSDQQKVIATDLGDRDIFALVTPEDKVEHQGTRKWNSCIVVFEVREGKLVNRKFFFPTHSESATVTETMASALTQYYAEASYLPDNIWTSHPVTDVDFLETALTERNLSLAHHPQGNGTKSRLKKVRIITPQKGEKAALVQMAITNGKLFLEQQALKSSTDQELIAQTKLDQLTEKLHLPKTPFRIEGFDISHIMGTACVGSMVVFVNGLPTNREYRLFNIRSLPEGMPNDVAAIYEVVLRRYSGTLTTSLPLPDFILIDGGKGQVNAAFAALKKLGLDFIPLFGLAKREEELYRANTRDPIRLAKSTLGLQLLQQVRDEAHRFAITRHRARRQKQQHSKGKRAAK